MLICRMLLRLCQDPEPTTPADTTPQKFESEVVEVEAPPEPAVIPSK